MSAPDFHAAEVSATVRAGWQVLSPARREVVLAVARRLAEAGYRAWLVGGAGGT
ncbi:MAG: hypothetical protein R3E96_04840 [Planctomycetota bacterium]